MKFGYAMLVVFLLVGCATQKSELVKPVLDTPQSTTCFDGSIQAKPELCPTPRADAIICPDGRAVGWPYECRSVEEIRLDNGNIICAEQDLAFNPKTDSCE